MIYEKLAYYYDALLGDEVGSKLWIDETKSHIKGSSILELACGSGYISNELSKDYHILATDISSDMIKVASDKYQNEQLEFKVMDMLDFNLQRKFDGIICYCDSINYVESLSQFKMMLENVYNHLNDNGVLMFDMHHINRIIEFEEEYIEEGIIDNIQYQWTILSNKINMDIYEHFAFWTNEGLFTEDHHQYVYRVDDIKKIMEEVGFKVKVIEDFIEDEKVMMIGEKIC